MRKIKKEELKKILENHKHWLEEDCEDWRDMRADLRSANLSVLLWGSMFVIPVYSAPVLSMPFLAI